jgi:hypothetical protein
MQDAYGIQKAKPERSRRDLALLEMVMHKHQRVAHAWHVKYERLRHATHESESIRINGPDHDACHACANPVLIFIQCSCTHARNIRRLLPMFDPSGVLDPVGILDPSGLLR